MYPYLTIFGKQYGTYALMALCGAFAAGIFMCYLTRRRGLNDNDSIILMLWSAVGVLVGGTLLYGITNIRQLDTVIASTDFKTFFKNLTTMFGGLVFYGGLLGGISVALITMKKRRMNVSVFSDMFAVCIPLFHAFARVGCFLGGCCYGIPCDIGFTAHNNPLVPAINDVSRFPVQLLEAGLNLLLFGVLYFLYRRTQQSGALTGHLIFVYLLLYAVIRFFDEFLRGDAIRGFIFGLSTSQFISCILFVVSATRLVVYGIRNRKRNYA